MDLYNLAFVLRPPQTNFARVSDGIYCFLCHHRSYPDYNLYSVTRVVLARDYIESSGRRIEMVRS